MIVPEWRALAGICVLATCPAAIACTNDYAAITSSLAAGAGGSTSVGPGSASGSGAAGGGSASSGGGSAGGGTCSDHVDCDGDPSNGCETNVLVDPSHCGGCARPCSDSHVEALDCKDGVCESSCAPGWVDCNHPLSPTPDDGCELAAGDSNCGACGLECFTPAQGTQMECGQGLAASTTCGCAQQDDCRGNGVDPDELSCAAVTGLCQCENEGGFKAWGTCRPGEMCGAGKACSCNDGAPCLAGHTCCPTDAGCRDLLSDPSHCTQCGRACSPGFVCFGNCLCDADPDCTAPGGTPGTCFAGACVCPMGPCAINERCLAGGSCG